MPDVYFSNHSKGSDGKKPEDKKPEKKSGSPFTVNTEYEDEPYESERKPARKVDDSVLENFEIFEDVYSDTHKRGGKPASEKRGQREPERRGGNGNGGNGDGGNGNGGSGSGGSESGNGGRKKGKKKNHAGIRILACVLALVLLLCFTGGIMAFALLGKISYSDGAKHENPYISKDELVSSPDVTNILLLGSDEREDVVNFRSDSMIVLSINKVKKTLTLISFLRDTYVEIPDHGNDRLNAACSYGGAELVMDTIEYNYKIDIDSYVLITFTVFEQLIDGIGGVYANISEAEAEYMHTDFVGLPDMVSGDNIHLNGHEALWYCRIRKIDSDWQRTERQREVMTSAFSQIKKTSPLKLYKTVYDVMPLVSTDLDKSDIIYLGTTVLPIIMTNFELTQQQIPAEGTWTYGNRRGMSVIIQNEDDNIEVLKTLLYS